MPVEPVTDKLDEFKDIVDTHVLPTIERTGKKIADKAFPVATAGVRSGIAWGAKYAALGVAGALQGAILIYGLNNVSAGLLFIGIWVVSIAFVAGYYERARKKDRTAAREKISRVSETKDRNYLITILKVKQEEERKYEAKTSLVVESYESLIKDMRASVEQLGHNRSAAAFKVALEEVQDIFKDSENIFIDQVYRSAEYLQRLRDKRHPFECTNCGTVNHVEEAPDLEEFRMKVKQAFDKNGKRR